jgi:membrane protein DedA with SNARE-associated domain
MFEKALQWLMHIIETLGYPGVFIMSALESTFLPIPSEATLIPAGYLIHEGTWNGPLVFALAVAGTLVGSLSNYAIAYYCGRYVLVKYGKYFLMDEAKLNYMESYFVKHGSLSIFLGRLVLGVRHFISFPAGLAKMDLKKFCLYTGLGGGIWTLILLVIGYMIGNNKELIMSFLPIVKVCFVLGVAAVGLLYWRKHRRMHAQPPQP